MFLNFIFSLKSVCLQGKQLAYWQPSNWSPGYSGLLSYLNQPHLALMNFMFYSSCSKRYFFKLKKNIGSQNSWDLLFSSTERKPGQKDTVWHCYFFFFFAVTASWPRHLIWDSTFQSFWSYDWKYDSKQAGRRWGRSWEFTPDLDVLPLGLQIPGGNQGRNSRQEPRGRN